MKMNALSYIIRYLQCLLINFQAAIYKKPHLQNVEHFEHVEPTIINIIKIFHLYYRAFALLQRILFIITKSLEKT